MVTDPKAFYVETLKCASVSIVGACKGTPILTAVELGILPEYDDIAKRVCLGLGRARYYRAFFGERKWNRT